MSVTGRDSGSSLRVSHRLEFGVQNRWGTPYRSVLGSSNITKSILHRRYAFGCSMLQEVAKSSQQQANFLHDSSPSNHECIQGCLDEFIRFIEDSQCYFGQLTIMESVRLECRKCLQITSRSELNCDYNSNNKQQCYAFPRTKSCFRLLPRAHGFDVTRRFFELVLCLVVEF